MSSGLIRARDVGERAGERTGFCSHVGAMFAKLLADQRWRRTRSLTPSSERNRGWSAAWAMAL